MAKTKAPLFVQSGMLPAEQLDLSARVTLWHETATKLSALKDEESVLRLDIVEKWFPNFEEGTHTGSMSNGYNLKCGMGLTRNVNQEQIVAAYEFANKLHNDPDVAAIATHLKELLDKVFRVKYELNLAEWRELSEDDVRRLADIVTEKPGKPTLKYEEKKS